MEHDLFHIHSQRQQLPSYVRENLAENELEEPYAIQKYFAPLALRHHNQKKVVRGKTTPKDFDIIGVAATGTGKTLAFLLAAAVWLDQKAEDRAYSNLSWVVLTLSDVLVFS